MSRYVLTERLLWLFGAHVTCSRHGCGRDFKVGDDVVSKAHGYAKRKYYHAECYDEMFIDA